MFSYSICDPSKNESNEMGDINKGLDIVDQFPWTDLLDKMKGVQGSAIHFSPSSEFENKCNRHGLNISIVEEDQL